MKQNPSNDNTTPLIQRTTRREAFLNAMDAIIPWDDWVRIIRPHYYKGLRGRPPIGIEPMLRMYLLQNWFDLSDEMVEDAIIDSKAMMKFVGMDFEKQRVPDATTLCHFRDILTKHRIGEQIFQDVVHRLEAAGLMMHGGTIVDATIIHAPSSTKNQEGKRDPDMHQTKKGNQWYFGMKVHAGADAGSGYVHTITATPAHVHDVTETAKLLREDDEVAYGDSAYSGAGSRPEILTDERLSRVEFRTGVRPSQIHMAKDYAGIQWDRQIESRKSSVRSKVEHPFLIVKVFFGYAKVVYRGIAKNLNRFHVLFASANLLNCIRAGRTAEFAMG